MSNDELRRLLTDAVPPQRAPEDRLRSVAARVARYRRRQLQAVTATAVAVLCTLTVAVPRMSGLLGNRHGDVPATQQTAGPAPTHATSPSAPTTPSREVSPDPAPTGTGPDPRRPVVTKGPGVAYAADRIPAGAAGSSRQRIVTATLQPEASDGTGVFRTVCRYSHMRPDDPVTAPGRPGGTVLHTFWGNTSTSAGSTGASLSRSGNSTCNGGTVNRSASWVPALIDTADGTPLAPDAIHVHYSSGYRGVRPKQVQPMPPGLVLFAGDPGATRPEAHGQWSCGETGDRTESIPACRPGQHVVMHLQFPQCWDGRRLDSPNHRSHAAFAQPGHGCPATHPVALPELSYHVLYPVPADARTAAWRLSSDTYGRGEPGGYTIHGGHINAWIEPVQRTWTERCVRAALSCRSDLLGDGRTLLPGN